jgi:hypothetical protein
MLLRDRQAGFAQFMREGVFIDLFKKSNAERIGNDERTSDDFLGDVSKGCLICVYLCSSVFICVHLWFQSCLGPANGVGSG